MKRSAIFIDSFSGAAADIPARERSAHAVLATLAKHPRVSCWDMEQSWLHNYLHRLEKDGLIAEDKTEPYPWLRFKVTDAGRAALTAGAPGAQGGGA